MSNVGLSRVAGVPIPVLGFMESAKQPSINEIAMMGEENFFIATGIFSISDKEEYIKRMLEDVPPEELGPLTAEINYIIKDDLDVFLKIAQENKYNEGVISSLLYIMFENYSFIDYKNRTIVFRSENGNKVINLNIENFTELNSVISSIFNNKTKKDEVEDFNPAGDLASQIAEKIKAARSKKAIDEGGSKGKSDSILGDMVSIVATGDGIPLQEVLKLTFAQLFIQFNRTIMLSQYRTQMTLGAFSGIDSDDITDWTKPL